MQGALGQDNEEINVINTSRKSLEDLQHIQNIQVIRFNHTECKDANNTSQMFLNCSTRIIWCLLDRSTRECDQT